MKQFFIICTVFLGLLFMPLRTNAQTATPRKAIPVFFASDENYAPFLATAAYSVLAHTTTPIDFYVLDGGISKTSKQKIADSLKPFPNHTIRYADMSQMGLERFPNLKHYTLNSFSRYFIPELFPDLGKIIYLDADIIVKKDIAELYNQSLDGYPVGAVLEDFYIHNYTTLKEKIYPAYAAGDQYFNNGVLLMDIPKFIQKNFAQQLIDTTIALYDTLSCPDQDIFNIVFENNFKKLDYRFNFMPDMQDLLYQKHPHVKPVDPVIIHYTAGKPWKQASARDADFWTVLNLTPFAGEVSQKYTPNTPASKQATLSAVPFNPTDDQLPLTIITICYNEVENIARTCDSIVNQTNQNFEWIVIDGGSTDGTVNILKQYADRINLLISEKDNGIYHAMNKGLRNAKGRYINFMNGGDAFHDNTAVQTFMEAAKTFDIDVFYGNIYKMNNKKITMKYEPPSPLKKKFFTNTSIPHQTCFTKKSLFDNLGYYDESYRFFADLEKYAHAMTKGYTFQKIPVWVDFDVSGVSAQRSVLHDVEKIKILKTYFTPEELQTLNAPPLAFQRFLFQLNYRLKNFKYSIFGAIPLSALSHHVHTQLEWIHTTLFFALVE